LRVSAVGEEYTISVRNAAGDLSTGQTVLDATTYHVGIYYKVETGSDDGIVSAWLNTDGSEFDAGDLIYNSSAVNTGMGKVGRQIIFWGQSGNDILLMDNTKVVNGAPSWPTS
jgi:hypothetical protein